MPVASAHFSVTAMMKQSTKQARLAFIDHTFLSLLLLSCFKQLCRSCTQKQQVHRNNLHGFNDVASNEELGP